AAKARRVEIATQRHGYRHGNPHWSATLNHISPILGIPRPEPYESHSLRVGIRASSEGGYGHRRHAADVSRAWWNAEGLSAIRRALNCARLWLGLTSRFDSTLLHLFRALAL